MNYLFKNVLIGAAWAVFTAVGNIIAQIADGKGISCKKAVFLGILLGVIAFIAFTFVDKLKKEK